MQLNYQWVWGLGLSLMMASQALSETRPAQAEGKASEQQAAADDRAPRVPTFPLEGDLAGQLEVVTTEYEDTFAGLGHELAFGYLELVKANPGIDPWLPGEGTRVILPRHYVLPDAPRQGIVINLAEYRLYYYTDGGVQVYPVGIGREENPSPLTDAKVTMPLESPAWYPPPSIRAAYEARGEYLPRMIPPGPDNPLGTHALLLSAEGYLIHGTNKRFGIGMAVSAGCFRMYNEDISRFVYQVEKGTSVQIIRQPVKLGLSGGEVWLEVHRPNEEYTAEDRDMLWRATLKELEAFQKKYPEAQVRRRSIELAVDQASGLPTLIGERLTQVASDKADEPNSDREAYKPEQTLYF